MIHTQSRKVAKYRKDSGGLNLEEIYRVIISDHLTSILLHRLQSIELKHDEQRHRHGDSRCEGEIRRQASA